MTRRWRGGGRWRRRWCAHILYALAEEPLTMSPLEDGELFPPTCSDCQRPIAPVFPTKRAKEKATPLSYRRRPSPSQANFHSLTSVLRSSHNPHDSKAFVSHELFSVRLWQHLYLALLYTGVNLPLHEYRGRARFCVARNYTVKRYSPPSCTFLNRFLLYVPEKNQYHLPKTIPGVDLHATLTRHSSFHSVVLPQPLPFVQHPVYFHRPPPPYISTSLCSSCPSRL